MSLILNADLSPSEAAMLISSTDPTKKISGGVFGWLFISNHLVKRLEQGVALNFDVNVKHLYGGQVHGGEETAGRVLQLSLCNGSKTLE